MPYPLVLKERFLSCAATMTMLVSSLLRSSYVVLYLQLHKLRLLDATISHFYQHFSTNVLFSRFIFRRCYHHMS